MTEDEPGRPGDREPLGLQAPAPLGVPVAGRTPDQQAVAMLAACLGYHQREEKPFWWAHYDRLISDPDEWTDKRSTFVADSVSVIEPWHVPAGKRAARRRLRMVGRIEPGSDLRIGAEPYTLYDAPLPPGAHTSVRGTRGWTAGITVLEVGVEADDGAADALGTDAHTRAHTDGPRSALRDVLVVADQPAMAHARHDCLPMALAPNAPPKTAGIARVIRELAEHVAAGLPALPDQPALDLLRRVPPRTRSGHALPGVIEGPCGYIDAITTAVLDLDGSYLAVQGPPGTGKTYTGARVIAALVDEGWHIGVVAQSHAVVENMLTAIAGAGVPAAQLGKKPNGTPGPVTSWCSLAPDTAFGRFYAAQSGGYVVGGTAWDFTNTTRLPGAPLDLLVIDEAGQFALADTVAVSVAARNLLLLGDPQQLPQVTQGTHPEPVDRSALGWLTDGHDTLPDELGYFLARSWRMHPVLCAAVSQLSYDGRLTSVDAAAERSLDGIDPGVHCVRVEHTGNAVSSVEEADVVVRLARDVIGRRWIDPRRDAPALAVDRPLAQGDVMVVAAYNAQVWTVRRALDAAGLRAVRVGTVDKFQGQEAPVVLVSMAASSPDDVPRGMEFLLDRNRVNVAVSRGQWCAVVVRSTALTDYLPTTPDGLEELGAFIGLCATGTPAR
ncbi:MAG TPA: DEAD/DEAH box helicase [Cellulomonas sp.]|uniref:DEAD/DEAH box helicase n=1 Tax=Cellulomonas sp. TaxID=40001 RepID=UPI002E36A696|nr:DEAD/DEAH box helicase [Cellulomonas sp.]HEX5331760.1 DEAD/DEAH box helicase [Cellulomonas sp.]